MSASDGSANMTEQQSPRHYGIVSITVKSIDRRGQTLYISCDALNIEPLLVLI